MRLGVTVILVAMVVAASGHIALAQQPPSESAKPEVEHHRDWASRHDDCSERVARLAGRLAYLEVKLDLTGDQHTLWDKWHDAAMDGAMKVRTACAEAPGPTAVDRAAHLQKVLATMASGMEAAQPALTALYQSLNDDQRRVLDWGLMPRHHHHGWDRHERHDHF